jgi:hypothetical protein
MMNENIIKAQQTANLLAADIKAAWQDAHKACDTENASHADRALRAFLADCLQAAHALESKLLML